MRRKINPLYSDLHLRIGEILHYVWDPIGIYDAPKARDEYDSYIPQVSRLLTHHATKEVLAAHLTEITTRRMGLQANPEHDLKTAMILIDWKNAINESKTVV